MYKTKTDMRCRMYKDICREFFSFVKASPTAFHTVSSAAAMLEAAGYQELFEGDFWSLDPGGKYYSVRGGSSIIAFTYPKDDFYSFSIVAPHGDSPTFKVKENPEIKSDGYTRLNTEVYGGMNISLWQDRPLSVAGRVLIRTAEGVKSRLINIDRDLFVIPALAIHMNRDVNSGKKLNTQTETLPLYGMSEGVDFKRFVADTLNIDSEDIISHDLYLYNRQEGTFYGENGEFIACPKLDDLQCAFSAVKAFIESENSENCKILAVFDNEEIGSMTKQGADSTFLSDIIDRICAAAGKTRDEQLAAVASGFALSADNAHAVHPGYPGTSDPTNKPLLGGGVVVKNATSYATDSVSSAVFRSICESAGVPVQSFYKRSDVTGGGTLGNIMGTHVSMNAVDIGLAQLSMHSPYETGGAKDTKYMIDAMRSFYNSVIVRKRDEYRVLNASGKNGMDSWTDISSR